MALRKIAFVIEDFVVGAPSQQLLDRFLIGTFSTPGLLSQSFSQQGNFLLNGCMSYLKFFGARFKLALFSAGTLLLRLKLLVQSVQGLT